MSYDYKDLILKKVNVVSPKNEHFALKNAEGVVTSVNVETKRCMVKIKQPDGANVFMWFDIDEITPEENIEAKAIPNGPASSCPPKSDPVNHPSHYTDGKYEVIDFIEDRNLDQDFRIANAVKYISRAGKKPGEDGEQDLSKALWYLNRYLQSTGESRFSPRASRNLTTQHPDDFIIEDYIKDKNLFGTLPGFALEAICYGCIVLAVHILEKHIAMRKNIKI